MKVPAPIYQLKRQAKRLAREHSIPLHQALDRIAGQHGFGRWSLLAARHAAASPARQVLATLCDGDMLLIGARPGQGKTLLSLELASTCVKQGGHAHFFSLDYTERDVIDRLRHLGIDPVALEGRFVLDCSDDICAAHIIKATQAANRGTLVIVDYLQVLDQNRKNPPLDSQLAALKADAEERGLVMVFLSQIDRRYDPSTQSLPGIGDVRSVNPLDLAAFTKTCFLHDGVVQYGAGDRAA